VLSEINERYSSSRQTRSAAAQLNSFWAMSLPPRNVTCHRALSSPFAIRYLPFGFGVEWSGVELHVSFLSLHSMVNPETPNPRVPGTPEPECPNFAPLLESWKCSERRCIKLPTTQSQSGLVFMTQKCFTLWLSRQPTAEADGEGGSYRGSLYRHLHIQMMCRENKEEPWKCGNRNCES